MPRSTADLQGACIVKIYCANKIECSIVQIRSSVSCSFLVISKLYISGSGWAILFVGGG